MTITSSQTANPGVANRSQGRYLDSAATPAAAVISVGFLPRYFAWINLTDRITWEWYEGMAAGTTLKTVAAGTRTLDTSDVAISPDADIATPAPGVRAGGDVTIAAAVIAQNKQYAWVAVG